MFCIILPLKKVKLAKYLHALLLQHETVIVPGFGAFISNYKHAEINKETNEIIPPSKEISFSPKIRNNDGLLVGYVAELHSVSHFNALKIIEKERENIIYRLDKGEQIILENIGVLYRNDKNITEFTQHIQENLLLDSFGLETVSLDEEEQEKESDGNHIVISETEEEAHSETLDEENTGQSVEKPEEVQITEEPVNQENEEVPEEDIVQASAEETEEKEEEKIPEVEAVATKEFVAEDQPEEERKKKAWLWFLLIFVPLIAVGIFLGKDKFIQKNGNEDVVQKNIVESSSAPKEIIAIPDSVANDSLQVQKPDTMEQVVAENIQAETPDHEKPKFYLVGGSFTVEENAGKFMEQFDVEGYEPFYIGKIGNFYYVGIGIYNSEKEAVEAKDLFLRENPDSKVWVPTDEILDKINSVSRN